MLFEVHGAELFFDFSERRVNRLTVALIAERFGQIMQCQVVMAAKQLTCLAAAT